jgi:hypothetical protein
MLESYNPSIKDGILRMGESIKADYFVLQQLTAKAWDSTFIQEGEGYLEFRTQEFLELPIAIQRLLLRRAIATHIPGLKDVGLSCIERDRRWLK